VLSQLRALYELHKQASLQVTTVTWYQN